MNLKYIYAALCVFGIILPVSQFGPWVMDNGFDGDLFWAEMNVNRVNIGAWLDLLVSCVTFWVFVLWEGRRLKIRHLWLPLSAPLWMGLSLGFPLFLFMRQRTLERSARNEARPT